MQPYNRIRCHLCKCYKKDELLKFVQFISDNLNKEMIIHIKWSDLFESYAYVLNNNIEISSLYEKEFILKYKFHEKIIKLGDEYYKDNITVNKKMRFDSSESYSFIECMVMNDIEKLKLKYMLFKNEL